MTTPDEDRPVVLVVDDDSDLADLYSQHLEGDYDVRTAYGGEAALEAYDEAVDVMLLDRRMPGLSGDEVLERVTEDGYDGGVIMLTAIAPDYDVIEMPFDEYLVKPITLPELSQSVERIVALNSDEAGPQRLYALLSKRYALEMRKGASGLHEDERYLGLLEEIETLKAELDPDVAKRIDAEASSAAFGALDGETIAPPDLDEIAGEPERSAGAEGAGASARGLGGPEQAALLDHVSDPIFLVDADRRIVGCNDAFVDQLGYSRSELDGQTASMLYVGRADGGNEGGLGTAGDVIDYRTKDGGVLRARTTVVSLDDASDGARRAAVLDVALDGADATGGSATSQPPGSAELEVATSLLRHEIGNDLNLVTAQLGTLGDGVDGGRDGTVERMEELLSETATKVDEFSEFLTLAGAGELGDTRSVELEVAVERAVDGVQLIDEAASFDIGDLDSTTVAANDLLDVVLRNLLDNAVRHHDGDEPAVSLDIEVTDDRVELRIEDDGPGIPPSIRSALTDPEIKDPASEGLGLGLFLVDRLVEAYGGSIRFEDREPTGTIATVELVRAE